jgi:hypothetical protein
MPGWSGTLRFSSTIEISHSGGVQARKNYKAERFPHTVAVPAALLDFDDTYKRVGWVDQI